MCLICLLMHAKFEGNPVTRLRFMAVFLQVCEKKKKKKEFKKNEENERLFEGLY